MQLSYERCGCPECKMKQIMESLPYVSPEEANRRNAEAEMERARKEYERTHWPCGKLRD